MTDLTAASAPSSPRAQLTASLERLAETRGPDLADSLASLFDVIATEASTTPRFATSLKRAFEPGTGVDVAKGINRRNRRQPASIDPFAIYAELQEDGLRGELASLTIDQLKDVVAQYGMNNDKLAMSWRKPDRLIDRIVDRVATRSSKGSAFK